VYIRLTITQPHPDSLQPQGLFAAAYALLREERELTNDERREVRALLDWFCEHLPIPRSPAIKHNAIFWFKPDARECAQRMWEMANLLRSHGRLIQLHKSESPGMIVFEDNFQVAAIPFRRAPRRRRREQPLYSTGTWRRFIRRSKAAHRSAIAWRRT